MPITIQFSQPSLPPQPIGFSVRNGLDTEVVTITTNENASSVEILDTPYEVALASVPAVSGAATTWTFTPVVGAVGGKYRVRATSAVDGSSTIRTFGVPDANGLLEPAWNESADPDGNLANRGASIIERSEDNASDAKWLTGNPSGWKRDLHGLYAFVRDNVLPALTSIGEKIYISGTTIADYEAEYLSSTTPPNTDDAIIASHPFDIGNATGAVFNVRIEGSLSSVSYVWAEYDVYFTRESEGDSIRDVIEVAYTTGGETRNEQGGYVEFDFGLVGGAVATGLNVLVTSDDARTVRWRVRIASVANQLEV